MPAGSYYGGAATYPGGYELPVPYGQPGPGSQPGLEPTPGPYGPPGAAPGPFPLRRRRLRGLRRAGGVILALAVLGTATFGGLLLITPSVGNAPQLARGLAEAHHAAYPGPPVPARFSGALVATEDHRFYSEPGFDPIAVGRVIAGRLTGSPDQGGATLYQQLAKMLYTPGQQGLPAQAEQVLLGIKLDLTYSKAAIVRMYADVAYFGNGYYGLAQASCGYFGVPPAGLSWPQAAMLAGLVQAPSVYDPRTNLAAARARQAHVLDRLAAVRILTQAQATSDARQPLHLSHGRTAGCTAA